MRRWDWEDWLVFGFDLLCLAILLFVAFSPVILGGVPISAYIFWK
jgi:hypothetical protein